MRLFIAAALAFFAFASTASAATPGVNVNNVPLSEAGWAIHDEVAPMARAHERDLLAKLDEGEQAQLNRILDKLMAP